METLVAVLTLVGAFPSVRPVVVHQVGLFAEVFPADGALVRFLSCMNALVAGIAGVVTEALLALGALIGALSGVGTQVNLQVRAADEAFVTVCTFKRPFPRVAPHMDLEAGVIAEGLAAHTAQDKRLSSLLETDGGVFPETIHW